MCQLSFRSLDVDESRVDEAHAHSDGQLLYATSGMITARVERTSWVLPPQRALWIPPHVTHEVCYRGPVELRTLYFTPMADVVLPQALRLIVVTPLMRELILEAIRLNAAGEASDRTEWTKNLILAEINGRANDSRGVVNPHDARLKRICTAILADVTDDRTIDDWAKIVGMSRRTLTRYFRAETGLSFAAWRQQARLQEAVSRLMMGQSISTVAYDVGYESATTFSTIFRQNFGMAPSRFLGTA